MSRLGSESAHAWESGEWVAAVACSSEIDRSVDSADWRRAGLGVIGDRDDAKDDARDERSGR